jgi:acyl carrier protein
MDAMRDAIAAAMARSKREIPHYYMSHRSDLTNAEAFIAERNAGKPPEERILIAALFVKAVAKALKKYKEFNGHYENGVFEQGESAHIGMAINIRGGGLVAPAIHDAQDLDLDTVMEKTRDLVARVRAGRFRAKELSDPTITVSSLGDRGVEAMFPIIYPPQVAIVGIGMPVVRPWVVGDTVVPRSTVTLTLAADHRVSDGHRGALFLSAIDKNLQEPEKIMSDDKIETALRQELHKIAPDMEVDDIDPLGDLREEFDIDSMDFLNLVSALSKSLGLAHARGRLRPDGLLQRDARLSEGAFGLDDHRSLQFPTDCLLAGKPVALGAIAYKSHHIVRKPSRNVTAGRI